MKFFVAFGLIAAFIACSLAQPIDHEVEEQGEHAILSRVRRVTCDLLGVSTPWGSLNDAACAAHCLTKGFKGGHCNNGVCNCRN